MKLPKSFEEKLPGALKERKVREDIKDKIELVMAFLVVGGFVLKKIQDSGLRNPIHYEDEDVAGVENVITQYGDEAVYNITVQEYK